jgi:hypothetical protein
MTEKRPDKSGKKRPQTVQSMVDYARKRLPIDKRTAQAKSICAIKEAVRTDLDAAAIALLEDDVATAQTIQAMCLSVAYKNPSKIINPDGSYHKALGSWLKFAGVKRAALSALKKFRAEKEPEPKEQALGDLILEVSSESERHEQPS